MERDPFNRLSNEPGPSERGSGTEESDKKKKKSKAARAEAPAKNNERAADSRERQAAERMKEAPQTLWQRILGEKEAAEKAETAKDDSQEATVDAGKEAGEQAAPLETLSEEEGKLAAAAYVAERQAMVAAEYAQAIEAGDEAKAAELEADAALLANMQEQLNQENGEEPAEEAIERAYEETIGVTPAESAPDDVEEDEQIL